MIIVPRKVVIGTGLAAELRGMHRALIDVARREYEARHEVSLRPPELLRLLTTDDAFAWLRGLSELMTDIDFIEGAVQRDHAIHALTGRLVDADILRRVSKERSRRAVDVHGTDLQDTARARNERANALYPA